MANKETPEAIVPPVPAPAPEVPAAAIQQPWETPTANAETEAPLVQEAPAETPAITDEFIAPTAEVEAVEKTAEVDAASIVDIPKVDETPEETPEAAPVEQTNKSTVTVVIPQAFDLTISHEQTKHFKAGITEMEPDEADHWYSKANGVKPYIPSV
jgi:hypothetical protein